MKICLVWGIVYGGKGDSPKGDKMPNDILFRIGNRRFPYVLYVRTCVVALRGIFFPPDPLSQLGNREEEGDVTIGED